MNKNPHRPGRPRKELSKEMVVALLTMYATKSTRQIAEELQVSRKGRVGCCRIYPCRGKRQTDSYKKNS